MNFIRVVFNSIILLGLCCLGRGELCQAANAAPTIATPASATPSPAIGTTATLAVLGADDGGEPALIYTWATTGTPPAAVTFSVNGTNAAKNTTATFTKSGTYNFSVTIKDTGNLTVVGNLVLVVNSTVTTITVTPAAALVNSGTTKQYTASAKNQFNTTVSPQPTFTWSVTGGGSISSSGLFTANTSTGTYTVQASAGGVNGTTTVQVNAAPTVATPAAAATNPVTGKTVVLTALGADDEGEPALVYTWATTGTPPAAVIFSPNGTNAAKSTTATFTKVGTYSIQVTIKDTHAATVISSLSVTVSPTFTSVTMSPVRATVLVGKTQTYVATGLDQFAAALASQPTFTWATTGGGTVSSAGVYTATTTGGPFNVTASASSLTGTATATVAGSMVDVNGHITTNTTFSKTTVYRLGTVYVDAGVTLTIQAGTVIKFQPAGSLTVFSSTVNAVGTAAEPIIFTSDKDDTAAGDTNADGAATAPARGDWYFISGSFDTTAMKFAYCDIRWGGNNSGGSTIFIAGKSFDMQNCTISNSQMRAIVATPSTISTWTFKNNTINGCDGLGIDMASNGGLTMTLSGNKIQNCAGPALYIAPDMDVGTFTLTANGMGNGVRVKGNSTNDTPKNTTWNLPSGSSKTFYIESDVYIVPGAQLTLPAGAIVKMQKGLYGWVGATLTVNGKLIVNGTSAAPVTITGEADDTIGGNIDGLASTPAPGDWHAINVAGSLVMTYCNVRYGGSINYGSNSIMVNCTGNSHDIQNCTFSDSLDQAANINGTTAPNLSRIVNSTFQRCTWGLGVGSQTTPNYYFFGNTFNQCSKGGLFVWGNVTALNNNFTANPQNAATLISGYYTYYTGDVRLSWWGDVSGPNAGVGTGTGGAVTPGIKYNPWRTAVAPLNPLVRDAALSTELFNPGSTTTPGTAVTLFANFIENCNWSLSILNSSSTVVRTYSGTGKALSQAWDGKDGSGTYVPAGNYTVNWTVTSVATPTKTESLRGRVAVDSLKPILKLVAPQDRMLVKAGDVIPITVEVKAMPGGVPIDSYYVVYSTTPDSTYFDSTIYGSNYTAPVSATVANFTIPTLGNSYRIAIRLYAYSAGVIVASQEAQLICASTQVSSAIFSPNGDGKFDTTVFTNYSIHPADWSLAIKNSSNVAVRTVALARDYMNLYTWDGKSDSAVVVPDGLYTANFTLTGPVNSITLSPQTEVDDTAPALAITDPVANQTITGRYNVVGSATDKNFVSYTLEYGSGAAPTTWTSFYTNTMPVTAASLGVFNTFAIPQGTYTVRLSSTDIVGNSNSTKVTVTNDRVNFSNFIVPESFAPQFGETAAIKFNVDKACQITVDLYKIEIGYISSGDNKYWQVGSPIIDPTPIRSFSTSAAGAGQITVNWNGRTGPNATDPLVGENCYLVRLHATKAGPPLLQGEYDPDYGGPLFIDQYHPRDPREFDVTNFTFTPATFVPESGQGVQYTFTLPKTAFVTIQTGDLYWLKTTLYWAQPHTMGAHTETWDGSLHYMLTGGGSTDIIPQNTFRTLWFMAIQTPINSLLVQNRLSIDKIVAEQYRIEELYDQVSTIGFNLSRALTVEIEVKDPNNQHFRYLRTAAQGVLAAGAQSIQWDGRDDQNNIVAQEGNYSIVIKGTDAATGAVVTSTGTVQVYK